MGTIKTVSGSICRGALVTVSLLYMIGALSPADLSSVLGIGGLLIMVSAIPLVKPSYGRPAAVFILLSAIGYIRYGMTVDVVTAGINSMLSIVAIITVLQLFIVPIRAGGYDTALNWYLKRRFTTEAGLYLFISLIAHFLGSFMLFGTVPMLYALFGNSLKEMVREPGRFTVTAIGRSFTLVTLWAPGAVSVVLVLESTGAAWTAILPSVLAIALLGLLTSLGLEQVRMFKGRKVTADEADTLSVSNGDSKKIVTLFAVAGILLLGILAMDLLDLLSSGSARVIVVGLVIALAWTSLHRKGGNVRKHIGEYWNNSLSIVPDLTVMFLAMGIFTEVIKTTPFIGNIESWIMETATSMGAFYFFMIPPLIIGLSLTGIHPFIGVIFLGSLLSSAMPDQTSLTALALLLGSAISYSVSPFAGTLITLSRFAGCSPAKAAFSWNGIFSLGSVYK